MKQKGFTLVELIGVIAIIAILGIITIPIIAGVLNNNSNSLDENQKKLIISAAKSYALRNPFELGDNDCVDVSELIKQGFLEDLSDDNANYNDYSVEIKNVNGEYQYNLLGHHCDNG